MKAVESIPSLEDVRGEPGTNAGGMLEKVRQVMANLTSQHPRDIKIQDLLAVDTFTPQKVQGGLANEFSQENAVGIAAMVKADRLQMEAIAREFAQQIGVPVEVGGVEADMAIRGALTTPGTNKAPGHSGHGRRFDGRLHHQRRGTDPLHPPGRSGQHGHTPDPVGDGTARL